LTQDRVRPLREGQSGMYVQRLQYLSPQLNSILDQVHKKLILLIIKPKNHNYEIVERQHSKMAEKPY